MKYPDEGYIKYNINWDKAPAYKNQHIDELVYWRDIVVKYGGIGYDNSMKVGVGNLSARFKTGFFISGSQTGHLQSSAKIFTNVTQCDLEKNALYCIGPVKASSESMTHYAVYRGNHKVNGIIHIHHEKLWNKNLNILPTTNPKTQYGTVAMAKEVELYSKEGHKVIIMAGHKDGILFLGEDLESAGLAYLDLLKNF